jgi:hypothetical protein
MRKSADRCFAQPRLDGMGGSEQERRQAAPRPAAVHELPQLDPNRSKPYPVRALDTMARLLATSPFSIDEINTRVRGAQFEHKTAEMEGPITFVIQSVEIIDPNDTWEARRAQREQAWLRPKPQSQT